MGRIKTTLIKRVTYQILEEHRDKFKDNFENNKKILADLADIESKKIRNAIAGYITRLVKTKED